MSRHDHTRRAFLKKIGLGAAALGAAAPPDMQGRSAVGVLKGKTPADWRESMYKRYNFSHIQTEPQYGVRTRRHKLICFNRIGQWDLFDLAKDTLEMKNLYEDPAYAATVKDLKAELARLQAELKDDPDDVGAHPRTGMN